MKSSQHQARKTKIKPKRSIVVRGIFTPYTGYGQQVCDFVSMLQSRGVDVKSRPICVDEAYGNVSSEIKSTFVHREQIEDWELIIHPPSFEDELTGKKKRIIYTMWETDRLPDRIVKLLNTYEGIIVPSDWCLGVFKKSGVKAPLFLVPLGIDTAIYKPQTSTLPEDCIFGCAGRLAHGGIRKGINQIISAFLQAFPPGVNDVMLRVKAFQDCALIPYNDPRIQVTKAYISEKSMVDWYHSLTCFVSASTAEGWGLHQQEAMACGKAVLNVNYGGVKMFFDPPANGYTLKHHIEQCSAKVYDGVGMWAAPSELNLIEQMQHIYQNRVECFLRGRDAITSATQFTKEKTIDGILSVMAKLGAL